LAASTAAYLALRRGRRVLALDLDPQGQLARVLGVERPDAARSALELLVDSALGAVEPPLAGPSVEAPSADRTRLPAVATRVPGLDVVPGHKLMGLVPHDDARGADPGGRLAAALRRHGGLPAYDFVLVDAPPSFGPLTLNALRAVDELVVPVPLTYLALDGCAQLCRTVEHVRHRHGHAALHVTMVVPVFYRRTRMAHEVLDRLKARFPKELAQTVVGYHVRIDEAQSRGQSIFEYAPSDRGARALAAVAEELEARGPAGPLP